MRPATILVTMVILSMAATPSIAQSPVDSATRTHYTRPSTTDTGAYTPAPHVDNTGSEDVTQLLSEFFSTVPDGSSVTFRPGTYRIEGSLIIRERYDLTIDGTGATFIATTDGSTAVVGQEGRRAIDWPRKRSHWLFSGGGGHTIRNLHISGPNAAAGPTNDAYVRAYEAQHGIELQAVSDVVVENSYIHNTYGDLVAVVGGSTEVTVRDNTLTHSGRQGVMVDQGHDVLVMGNTIDQIGRSAVDLEPAVASWHVSDVRIIGNQVGRANGAFVAAYGRGTVNHVLIENNVLVGQGMGIRVKGTHASARYGWVVRGNTSDVIVGAGGAPLRFINVVDVRIEDNRQPIASTQGRRAVDIAGATEVVIDGNDFPIHNTLLVPDRPPTGEQADIIVDGLVVDGQPVIRGSAS